MIKIEAYVREEKFEDVKEALSQIEVHGITVYQVMGCGIQKGYTEIVRGNEIEVNMLPKIKFEIIVSDENWEAKTIAAIKKAAFTGNPSDGKIISYNLKSALRIRTGETGSDLIRPERIRKKMKGTIRYGRAITGDDLWKLYGMGGKRGHLVH